PLDRNVGKTLLPETVNSAACLSPSIQLQTRNQYEVPSQSDFFWRSRRGSPENRNRSALGLYCLRPVGRDCSAPNDDAQHFTFSPSRFTRYIPHRRSFGHSNVQTGTHPSGNQPGYPAPTPELPRASSTATAEL